MMVRPWPPPQGQRKELLGLEGKGSRPCMEENELYSSAATGTGAACLGCGEEEVQPWGQGLLQGAFLPVVAPSLASPLIGLPALLPGAAQGGGAWPAWRASPSPVALSLLPRCCWWLGARLRVSGGAALEPFVVGNRATV